MFFKANMREEVSIKLYADVGMDELFMARLMHLRNHILQGFGMKKVGVDWENIQNDLWPVIFEGLVPAFRNLRPLRVKWADPKIAELEKTQMVETILGYLVVAFKDRFGIVATNIGYPIGFMFQANSNFEKGIKEFGEKYPSIDPRFLDTFREDRAWSSVLL